MQNPSEGRPMLTGQLWGNDALLPCSFSQDYSCNLRKEGKPEYK